MEGQIQPRRLDMSLKDSQASLVSAFSTIPSNLSVNNFGTCLPETYFPVVIHSPDTPNSLPLVLSHNRETQKVPERFLGNFFL